MVLELQRAFNAAWTPAKYARFLELLDGGCGTHVAFRNCETPTFLDPEMVEAMARAGAELTHQLVDNAEYLAKADATIPPDFHVAHVDARPLFLQADFGVAEGNRPKLVEIQAFPSLYAYQPYLAETYRQAYGLPENLTTYLGGLDAASYRDHLHRAVVGRHDPENVVLMEIDPQQQKTLPDFLLTERMLGVKTVCLTKIRQEGRKLYYERDGRRVPIHRIYNRAIVDELQRKNVRPGFDLTGDLDVEWAGHPNWYYRISKFSIPYLRHETVPRTWFLDELRDVPEDLDNYVLKPLYSFAGLGVLVGPDRRDLDAVPADQRANYILQERIQFIPTVETPEGPTKAEVRVMYLWTDELRPVTTIIRMGRGKMMGVDHNKNMNWVGASAGFLPVG
jgi:hypothetical protein